MNIEELIKSYITYSDTYIGEAPYDKDVCQWIRLSSGNPKVHFGTETFDKVYYSIYIRGNNNQETSTRTKTIYDTLKTIIECEGALITSRLPSFVGRDDKNRSVYTFQLEFQLGGY